MNERRRSAPRCGAGAAATSGRPPYLRGADGAGRPTGRGRAGPSGTARSGAAARPSCGDRIGGPAVGVGACPAGRNRIERDADERRRRRTRPAITKKAAIRRSPPRRPHAPQTNSVRRKTPPETRSAPPNRRGAIFWTQLWCVSQECFRPFCSLLSTQKCAFNNFYKNKMRLLASLRRKTARSQHLGRAPAIARAAPPAYFPPRRAPPPTGGLRAVRAGLAAPRPLEDRAASP